MDDLAAVSELIIASDIAEFGEPDYSLEDLRDEWEDYELTTDVWVVTEPSGRIVGYANVAQNRYVRLSSEVYVHPEHTGRGIGTHLVRLAEGRAREFVECAPPDARMVLNNYINGANEAASSLLQCEGYTLARRHWRMQITMDEPPPAPELPPGIVVRTFIRGRDERAVYDAVTESFSDMWGYVAPSYEEFQEKVPRWYGDDPTLWFLATEGDEIAGSALCTYFLEKGWIRTLGVRRPWRKQGVGLALLRAAFGEFYNRGKHEVGLGVDSQSLTGANRLYERAGMRVTRQFDQYQKELRPGRDYAVTSDE